MEDRNTESASSAWGKRWGGGWFRVDSDLIDSPVFAQLSPTAAKVYFVIARHANRQRQCWPSVATIARKAGVGRTVVFKALGDLERARLIRRVNRIGRSTLYVLPVRNAEPNPFGIVNDSCSGFRTQNT